MCDGRNESENSNAHITIASLHPTWARHYIVNSELRAHAPPLGPPSTDFSRHRATTRAPEMLKPGRTTVLGCWCHPSMSGGGAWWHATFLDFSRSPGFGCFKPRWYFSTSSCVLTLYSWVAFFDVRTSRTNKNGTFIHEKECWELKRANPKMLVAIKNKLTHHTNTTNFVGSRPWRADGQPRFCVNGSG